MKDIVTVGVVGAGRALELHSLGYKRSSIPVRLKTVMARRSEQINKAIELYRFERGTTSYDDLLNDPEIDVIDICTPPYVHKEEIILALKAGKHVICEKPLVGYFGRSGDSEPIGNNVSKKYMYECLIEDLSDLRTVLNETGKRFMYAENFVYAPAVLKAGEIIRAKKSRILYMKGEESLNGSSSALAGEWNKTGGGIFMRNGVHPLGAILYLKNQEAIAHGENIAVKSVFGDMGYSTKRLNEYEHRHIAARPHDVEDAGTAIITFTDGSKATIISTDNLLGGSKNYIEIYANDTAINCLLTMNNAMETYMLDSDGMDSVYLSEMLPTVTGWNKPFIADETLRGYCNEIEDFMRAIIEDREPESGFNLAEQVMKVTYAAYYSDEEERRIYFSLDKETNLKTEKIHVEVSKPYDVLIGKGLIDKTSDLIASVATTKKLAIITDDIVSNLYLPKVTTVLKKAGYNTYSFIIANGETSKNMATLSEILEFLAENKLHRNDAVIALGGGVVGDITGLAASMYMRGMSVIQIPTTLLSSVDSSVGGKTAIDLSHGKNLAGTFWQPSMVICDVDIIELLPNNIFAEGMAEVIKCDLIGNLSIIEKIQDGTVNDNLAKIITSCISLKRDIVEKDEFDKKGIRNILNMGHTVAHAIEKLSSYKISHGKAVGTGLIEEAKIAERLGICEKDLVKKIRDAVIKYDLLVKISWSSEELVNAMKSDKKNQDNSIMFVLPCSFGKYKEIALSAESLVAIMS